MLQSVIAAVAAVVGTVVGGLIVGLSANRNERLRAAAAKDLRAEARRDELADRAEQRERERLRSLRKRIEQLFNVTNADVSQIGQGMLPGDASVLFQHGLFIKAMAGAQLQDPELVQLIGTWLVVNREIEPHAVACRAATAAAGHAVPYSDEALDAIVSRLSACEVSAQSRMTVLGFPDD